MGVAEQQTEQQPEASWSEASWCCDSSPLIMSKIFSSRYSVSIWQRPQNKEISDYFNHVFGALGMGVRAVLSMQTLKRELSLLLPDAQGKQSAEEDIYLLSDMLTCLFDCQQVGLRIAPLSSAMCPNFHTDNIPVRLVTTYLGSGTQWLPKEDLKEVGAYANAFDEITISRNRYCYQPIQVQQVNAFDVALLKGTAWDNQDHMAALHRSCDVGELGKRVLLTLDPM